MPPETPLRRLLRAFRQRSPSWLGMLGLVVAFAPAPAWAQPATPPSAPEEPVGTEADPGESEGEVEPAAGSRAPEPPSGVEVIRIKGRAVAGIETEVPVSVTQFDAADLEALGAQNISDLAKVTPNVEIKTAGSTAPTFFIRGVGLSDFSANAAGAVAIYRDDVAINAPAIQLSTLFDLENVEVLRGPQGAGSGRNASAGAIKLYSRKPTGNLGAELRSTFGRYNLRDFEGAIEAPLADEVLSTRLAFRWTERDPYAKNGCGGFSSELLDRLPPAPPQAAPGEPQPLGEQLGPSLCGELRPLNRDNPRFDPTRPYPSSDPAIRNNFDADGDPRTVRISALPGGLADKVNDLGNWAARGQLRFQPPGTEMDWLLNLHGGRTDQLSTLGQASGTIGRFLGGATSAGYTEPDQRQMLQALGGAAQRAELGEILGRELDIRPYRGDYDRTGDTKLDTWGATLRGDWAIGPVNFTSVSGYEHYERFRNSDQDFTPDVLFEAVAEDEAWQFFQELRLYGELADLPLRWEAGGYYLMEDLHSNDDSLFSLGSARLTREYTQKLWSFAGYAGFAWDFLDDFTLEGGVRYNWDRKDFDFTVDRVGSATRSSFQTLLGQAPTGTLTLSYRLREDASVYWKYSRGWKPGTFNSIAQTARNAKPAEPETINAFEVGMRGAFLDGRAQLGGALFYYSYTDYQVFTVADEPTAPPTFQIINANDAEVYGAELDLQIEPLVDLVPSAFEGLVITARSGWLETQFLDFTTQVVRAPAPGVLVVTTLDFTGNTLINSPQFKVSGSAEWTFDLGRFGAIIPRYDLAWTSDIFFDPNEGKGSPDAFNVTYLPDFTTGQPAYWLHNARLAYRTPEGNIEVAAWVRNFTDEVYKPYAFDASSFSGVVVSFVGEPRTYGLDFIVRF